MAPIFIISINILARNESGAAKIRVLSTGRLIKIHP